MHIVFNPKNKYYCIPDMIFNYTVVSPKCDMKYLGFIVVSVENEATRVEIRRNVIQVFFL